MAQEYYLSPPKKAAGNLYPKRGQIKARIFGSIARSLADLATTKGARRMGRGGDGQGSSASSSPTSSGYCSEATYDA